MSWFNESSIKVEHFNKADSFLDSVAVDFKIKALVSEVRLVTRLTAARRDALKISPGLVDLSRRMMELRQGSGNRVMEQKTRSDSVCWSSTSFSWDLLYFWMRLMMIAPIMRATRMVEAKKDLMRNLFR